MNASDVSTLETASAADMAQDAATTVVTVQLDGDADRRGAIVCLIFRSIL